MNLEEDKGQTPCPCRPQGACIYFGREPIQVWDSAPGREDFKDLIFPITAMVFQRYSFKAVEPFY